MVALTFVAKDQTTLTQHLRHTRISRQYYGHFSTAGSPRSSWGSVTLWNAVSSPTLELGEDPAATIFVHVRDTGTMLLAIKELQILGKLEMWANAQRDSHPAEYRWRPLYNAAKFG